MSFYFAAIALPLVAGLLRFSVAYGYEGKSRAMARVEARQVAIILGGIAAFLVIIRLANGVA